MKTTLAGVFLFSAISAAAVAAEPVITETDTEIIVEYSGTPDEKPASPAGALAPESAQGDPAAAAPSPAAAASAEAVRPENVERTKMREELRKARELRRSSRQPGQDAGEGAAGE